MREAALSVVRKLHEAGYESYLVGGCVRDTLLGREPKDYDITTVARPEQVREVFADTKSIPVGAQFGVVILMVDGHQIEVATFRADGDYSDGRRPDSVSYSDTAKEDVTRRDFTVNGILMMPFLDERVVPPWLLDRYEELAYADKKNLPEGQTIWDMYDGQYCIADYVQGREDLENRVIRCIGNPVHRFTEDKLRMLRAVRFAAQLGFDIEEETKRAIVSLAHTISVVSRERIREELYKLLTAKYATRGIALLFSTGLAREIFPNSKALDVETMLRRFERFHVTTPLTALAMFLDNEHGPYDQTYTERMADTLKMSNDELDEVKGALRSKAEVRRVYQYGEPCDVIRALRLTGFRTALLLVEQDFCLFNPVHEAVIFSLFAQGLRAYTEAEINPKPLVTGDDLIAMGLTPGPQFKNLLFQVETLQLNGVLTEKESALAYVRRINPCN